MLSPPGDGINYREAIRTCYGRCKAASCNVMVIQGFYKHGHNCFIYDKMPAEVDCGKMFGMIYNCKFPTKVFTDFVPASACPTNDQATVLNVMSARSMMDCAGHCLRRAGACKSFRLQGTTNCILYQTACTALRVEKAWVKSAWKGE